MLYSDGAVAPCCFFISPIKTEKEISNLKESFVNDLQDPRCNYCWEREEKGTHSPRHDFNKLAGVDFKADQSIDTLTDVIEIQLNIGNYCNAECIMCDGHNSSRRNTWVKKNNPKFYIDNSIQVANDTVDFSIYPNLKTIGLIGGEPSIHPTTHAILDKLINDGVAQNISIRLNTNASRLDQKLLDKLIKFDQISITLSIDGSGPYFEYQRRPLQWETTKQVSEKWMSISNNITINYVVTAISVWGFNGFIEWYENLSDKIKEKRPCVIFTSVFNQDGGQIDHLSVKILDDNQRKEWSDMAVEHPFKYEIERIMSNYDYDPGLLPSFKQAIELEDQSSKIKFSDLFPTWNLNAK